MLKGIMITGLFLAYPYLVYQGSGTGMSWLAPMIIAGVYLRSAWLAKQQRARIVNALIAVVLLLGAYYLQTLTAKLLPVLIQLMLMVLFGRTLLNNAQPSLIERIVRLQYPEFPPVVSHYCRTLTAIWTAFFAGNVLVSIVLALWGSELWWALYNGVIVYVMMAVLAVGEYVYRRHHFADLGILHQGIPDPQAAIKAMIINGRRVFLDLQER